MKQLMLFCFLFALAIAASLLLSAEDAPTVPDTVSTPLTRQEVWQAVTADLRERGVPETQLPRLADLDLAVAVPAIAGRKLRVSSACWDEGVKRAQFRLECVEAGQCLPFLVYVAYVHDVHSDGERKDGEAQLGSCRLASGPRPGAETPLKATGLTVHPGDRATTVLVSDRLRISASVTCLDRGREGDIIRVRGEDGEVFRARISGPALLEAIPQ